jgi:hypothetical protein
MQCCQDAARIAKELKLHHVSFLFNGDSWVMYADYNGFAMRDGRKVAECVVEGWKCVIRHASSSEEREG